MARMIIFDGIDIRSVADVEIEDIRVSPVEISPVSRPRAIGAGSVFVRDRYGTRTVAVTFALMHSDINTRHSDLLALSAWAKSDKEYKLEIPGYPDKYLMAVCTKKPEPSMRQWWETKLRFTFTCINDPFWNSSMERSVACGTAVRILGDAPPLMRITRTLSSAASNQTYSMNGKSMTFSTIPAGSMVIDLNAQTAKVGNSSIMQYYNPTSRFLIPSTGNVTVSGTGTVVYRERWQ